MAKPDEEKSDGLEIISIGTLYGGPWDKKYWSSSRGKDRYPYPVGYKAVRTHNGITYKMEIHEGLKGPSFSITSTDGQSCSGQTPDIAWESFQKKGCPHMKLWHGKRFSCKIDGVEFFGFKNSFVQRLLRELVANVGGTAEQSCLTSSFGKGDSGRKDHTQCAESHTYPDRLPYLARPEIKGKRSRKHKTINFSSTGAASQKKLRPKDQVHNNESSYSRQGTQNYINGGTSLTYSASNEEYNICSNNQGTLAALMHLETVVEGENNPFSVKHGLPSECCHSSYYIKEDVPPQIESKNANSESCIPTGIAGNLSIDDRPLGGSNEAQVQGFSSSMEEEHKDGEAPVSKDTQNFYDMDLCAPDTLDLLHDSTYDSQSNSRKESPCYEKCELLAGNVVVSEGLATESQPEGEMGTSNASSEKNDFDSVGQEIAKSMMTVLLPRALPLLKTFSRKKKTITNPPEISSFREKNKNKNNGTDQHVGVESPGVNSKSSCLDRQEKENMHILNTDSGSDFPSFGQNGPVVPDSVKNDQSCSDIAEAGLDTMDCNQSRPDTLGLPVGVDALDESSICHVGSSYSKNIFSYKQGHMNLIEKPKEGDILISVPALGCTSSTKNIFLASNKDMFRNSDKKFLCLEIQSKENDLKTSSGCTEGTIDENLTGAASSSQTSHNEISVKTGGAGTGNTSFTEIPNADTLTRQHNGPLTESIIFRSSADGCAPETYATTNFFPASEIQQASSFDHDPYKRVPSGADATLEGWPNSSHTEKNTTSPNGVLTNTGPVISKNQAFVCPSNDKDNMDVLDPSASCTEKSQASVDKELQKHQNLFDVSSSESWLQNQGTSFCVYNREIADDSRLDPQMDMGHNDEPESVVHFVGCYVHPLPVSLVLLSTKENEICICVLCGVLVDRDKTLFMYKVSLGEQMSGCPSFLGHTPILLQFSRDTLGRDIALDRSSLQFTPDGQSLVFLNSIRAPYCVERKMQCPCSACRLDCSEKNAVKVVQVKRGYVSVLVKLKTVDNVHCILVCEPNYLVGIDESGRLHLWVMNSTWSAQIEECDLSTSDCIFPCIVELKRIPNCAALILGHNGFGEFGLWDICKRIFVARFSSPSTSVFQFLPVSLFTWQREGPVLTEPHGKEHITEIMTATKKSFSEQSENHALVPTQGEDVAIWLLISTICRSNVQHDFQSSDHKIDPVGLWRLALLVKNRVILGSVLDPRATAIGTSAGHGIIGTCDGLVYVWELSTGTKLRDLHCFQGSGVSCIATDDSRLGPLAIAAGGQLRVYLHSQGPFQNN